MPSWSTSLQSLELLIRWQVEARGGNWVFHRCQLRAIKVGGGSSAWRPLSCDAGRHRDRAVPSEQVSRRRGGGLDLDWLRIRMKILSCGVGGICTWNLQAASGVLAYETSELLLAQSVIEWYNGVDIGLCKRADVKVKGCSLLGRLTEPIHESA
eukprot:758323-Hanusia_phi.AAC.4